MTSVKVSEVMMTKKMTEKATLAPLDPLPATLDTVATCFKHRASMPTTKAPTLAYTSSPSLISNWQSPDYRFSGHSDAGGQSADQQATVKPGSPDVH